MLNDFDYADQRVARGGHLSMMLQGCQAFQNPVQVLASMIGAVSTNLQLGLGLPLSNLHSAATQCYVAALR